MNRMRTGGLVAVLVLAGCVAVTTGGAPRRTAAPKPVAVASPSWLASVAPSVPRSETVYRTEYLSASNLPSPTPTTAVELDSRPLVWVLDGAGDYHGCSSALAYASLLAGNPIELCQFVWTHGHNRLLLDQIDMAHSKAQGARLAAKIAELRRSEPTRRIAIVAHSAGCAVALAACESLPPDTIDRLILLAPSVSTGYDIRPALQAAREGIDVFCSKKDWLALGFVTRMVGTTDKFWAKAAGRHGFGTRSLACTDEYVAGRLRQHFWTPEMARTGHTGGHYGVYAPAFIQAYLFPLMGVSGR